MNAKGGESWQKCAPWQLLSCLSGLSKDDCFVMSTDLLEPTQPTKQPGSGGVYQTPSKGQPYMPVGRRKRLNRVCPLFNKVQVGCQYKEELL